MENGKWKLENRKEAPTRSQQVESSDGREGGLFLFLGMIIYS
jgi:hypothetical protein